MKGPHSHVHRIFSILGDADTMLDMSLGPFSSVFPLVAGSPPPLPDIHMPPSSPASCSPTCGVHLSFGFLFLFLVYVPLLLSKCRAWSWPLLFWPPAPVALGLPFWRRQLRRWIHAWTEQSLPCFLLHRAPLLPLGLALPCFQRQAG